MKSLSEEMGGTYRQEGDYLIPNLALPEEPNTRLASMDIRRSYLKEHRPIFYTNLLTNGTLHGTLPRSTKPATSAWKSSFLQW